jgi:hypothetical protein
VLREPVVVEDDEGPLLVFCLFALFGQDLVELRDLDEVEAYVLVPDGNRRLGEGGAAFC